MNVCIYGLVKNGLSVVTKSGMKKGENPIYSIHLYLIAGTLHLPGKG